MNSSAVARRASRDASAVSAGARSKCPNLVLAGVIVNRWERTVEHRNSTAEIERYFGAHIPWQPYVPKRTALQDAARQGVPVHHLAGAVARELADAFSQLTTHMEPVRAVG
jgi:hypothetical protein